MQFSIKVIALFSTLSATAFASDVYSSFLDSSGAEIGSTNFDVGNPGCFSIGGATQIDFSQSGGTSTANGPYCLSSFTEGGCAGTINRQQFENVSVNNGQTYALNDGISNAASYMWNTGSCP